MEDNQACLPSDGKMDWERIADRKELENSLACLLYSSGTTGVPKGRPTYAQGSLTGSIADSDDRSGAFTYEHCS